MALAVSAAIVPSLGLAVRETSADDDVHYGERLEAAGFQDVFALGEGCEVEATCEEFFVDDSELQAALTQRLSYIFTHAVNHVVEGVRLDSSPVPYWIVAGSSQRLPDDFAYVWRELRDGRSVSIESGHIVIQGSFGPGAIECSSDSDCDCDIDSDEFCWNNTMVCEQNLCR